jgi:DNA-binding SARP family transcriptional activator
MPQPPMNLLRLYLPLLSNHQPEVRHQACLLLLGTYGDHALTYLRRMAGDTDQQLRQEARLGLLAIAEISDVAVKMQPFRGMYVECLGRLNIYIGNHEMQPQDWGQAQGCRAGWQKVQAMLAYLIHCGRRGASRSALGAAAWEKSFSDTSFARTLTALQQAIKMYSCDARISEPVLLVEGDHCLLDPQCYHTDVQLFERAYGLATEIERDQGLARAAPIYEQAIQLYSGPYMAGVAAAASWCRRRREHLMNSFVIAAERLAEHAYAGELYARCIDMCLLALDADPAADEIVAWLLRAYAGAEQYAELERAYRSYLHAAQLDALSDAGQQDQVVQLYQSIGQHALDKQVHCAT